MIQPNHPPLPPGRTALNYASARAAVRWFVTLVTLARTLVSTRPLPRPSTAQAQQRTPPRTLQTLERRGHRLRPHGTPRPFTDAQRFVHLRRGLLLLDKVDRLALEHVEERLRRLENLHVRRLCLRDCLIVLVPGRDLARQGLVDAGQALSQDAKIILDLVLLLLLRGCKGGFGG